MRCADPRAGALPEAFLSLLLGLPSATACASCSQTIPTAITLAASWYLATCWPIWSAPRSSSPTTKRLKAAKGGGGCTKRRRQRRERVELSKGGRAMLQGRGGEELDTLETEGQMLQRVMPDLMGLKDELVINDEAHHCYREKPEASEDDDLKGDEKKEAEENNAAARLWISGLEAVQRKLGLSRVFDLSATPFFLRGSGYAEGTLFPWTMSDFSLMDAIECGIVKLPRVPVADNIPGAEMPMFRNLW